MAIAADLSGDLRERRELFRALDRHRFRANNVGSAAFRAVASAQNDPDENAEKAADKSPLPSQLALATISGEACQVRCFASNLSPVYETTLTPGTVVQVGEAVGEFRRVVLPLGVVGYVSKRFTAEPAEGLIKTLRKRVSFRYRPIPKNRAEAPVQMLGEGTELHYVGAVGEWWKVRFASEFAYLPINAITIATESTEEMRKSYAELGNAQEAEWSKATAGYAAAAAAVAAKKLRDERLDGQHPVRWQRDHLRQGQRQQRTARRGPEWDRQRDPDHRE